MNPTVEATTRSLMALVTDIVDLMESASRVMTQVEALAKEHGVQMPPPSPSMD